MNKASKPAFAKAKTAPAKKPAPHNPAKNLGKFLHPKKGPKGKS